MKTNLRIFMICMLVILFSQASFSQTEQGKVALGLNAGATRIFGDGTKPEFGFTGGGSVAYRILPFADFGIGGGYGQLGFNSFSTTILNVDVFTNLEIVSRGKLRPYITLGAGLINYENKGTGVTPHTSSTYFGGGGVRLIANSIFDIYLGADYRFTDTDLLDAPIKLGDANDGYLNIRTGFNYHLGPKASGREPQVIASEKAPFVEIDDQGFYQDDYNTDNSSQNYNETRPSNGDETKNMEEYVRMKSRIDQLSENVDSREKEVGKLRNDLSSRKNRLSSMETRAANKPSVQIRRSSSMNSFSDIYEEALTNYYNKNFSEAISLFELLLQQYPRHTLASNCQFWIGQSLFASDKYDDSIAEFYKVLNFKRSLKKDDALLVLGKAYLKTGSGNRAKESFSRLISDYPNSEFVSEAKSYLARL